MRKETVLLTSLILSLSLKDICCREPVIISRNNAPVLAEETDIVDEPVNPLAFSPLGKNLNAIVDTLIKLAQEILQKSGHATIPIPDIQESFSKKIHHIKITGTFKASNGWFKDLSSIHRTTDATLSHSGGNISVSVGLGLNTLKVGYNHYQLKVKHFSVSGNIDAEAASNSVSLKVAVNMLEQGKCNLTVNELKIDLNGLKVHVGGKKKPIDWILSKIATSVAKHMKDEVIREAEKRLSEAAQQVLDKYHC